jgi:bile acid:Na+ symporter, BASS family
LVLRRLLRRHIQPIVEIFPSVSILVIMMLIACVVGLNQNSILQFPVAVFIAIIIHNTLELLLGYWGGHLLKMEGVDCRTIGIEVGMQNAGLGVALASQFVSPTAALPSAIFGLWHNLSGITLAKYWSEKSR